jgi:hypothetical protein
MSLRSRLWSTPYLRCLVAGALCFSLGLQWAALQSIAWMGMAVSYSLEKGVMTGLSETFDGEHPCPLCQAVEEGKKHQQEAPESERNESNPCKWVAILEPAWQFHLLELSQRPMTDAGVCVLSHNPLPELPPPRV